MSDISDYIEEIGDIIDIINASTVDCEYPIVDAQKGAQFREQYDKIVRRNLDKNFYLSTIGDFNAGKSSLINALIKRKLLKTGNKATTAVPTYIYKGNNNWLVVKAICDNNEIFDLTSDQDVEKFEKRYRIQLPQEIADKISFLTAQEEFSLKMKEVHVELPHGELSSGFCIIDTPGTNAGADYAQTHEEITKRILEEKADALIVLFPAAQAYTQTFSNFLEEQRYAEFFMKDAIFVVTQMDLVAEEERDDVVSFVKSKLRNRFNLKEPQVLFCSAALSQKDPYWSSQFKEFEASLKERLAKNRERIVTEKLVNLSNELLSSIQAEALKQKNAHQEKLSVLQSHSVPDLYSALNEVTRGFVSEMDRVHRNFSVDWSSNLDISSSYIHQRINTQLDSCTTRSELENYVKDTISSDIVDGLQDLSSICENYAQRFVKVSRKAQKKSKQRLETFYGEIGREFPVSSFQTDSQFLPSIDLDSLTTKVSGFNENLNLGLLAGGSTLAVLIALLLGPAGLFLGAVATFFGNRWLTDMAREKAREMIFERLPDIVNEAKDSLLSNLEDLYLEALSKAESFQSALIESYEPVYEKLQTLFKKEEKSLATSIERGEDIQTRIDCVLQQLKLPQ